MENDISEHSANLRAMRDAIRDIRRDPDLGPKLTAEVYKRVLASGSLIEHSSPTPDDWPSGYE
jgi:hypothetical protein